MCDHELPLQLNVQAEVQSFLARQRKLWIFRAFSEWFLMSLWIAVFLFQTAGAWWTADRGEHRAAGPAFFLGGTLLMTLSLLLFARIKNRHWAWGLLGGLSLLGGGIVLMLRSRCWRCASLMNRNDECPGCPS